MKLIEEIKTFVAANNIRVALVGGLIVVSSTLAKCSYDHSSREITITVEPHEVPVEAEPETLEAAPTE